MELNKGLKYDEDKLRWDLLPIMEVEEIVKVLTYGAAKYTDNSWQQVENGIERYYAAMMRHIIAWRKGEDIDPESKLKHLSHAATNALFLLYLTARLKKSPTSYKRFRLIRLVPFDDLDKEDQEEYPEFLNTIEINWIYPAYLNDEKILDHFHTYHPIALLDTFKFEITTEYIEGEQ